ncbi:Sister chromatid cohesion protein Dcc1 [Penicillium angulare]|uniref:Sister chromatid cohesion protein Dcc1 n=1 Tax=Penicillium angulare TaxID=116970 RepID=UPI0025412C25|nr:Sister chromatid cohesion protein Dcc1 [Penicillium angulare]KAJ5279151.1 Sister chromatid cohesion protein Dcc1 [Penicillium angulare]
MTTQDSRGILFTNTQPQQGFRLLELPPELDTLLSAKDAPSLELKSPSAALAQAVPDSSAQEYVNLCTADKTYRIRQVQSSNSIHIIRPSLGRISRADIKVVEEEAGESGALNLPDDAVSAIAKCGSTLELHIPEGGFSAVPFLERSLQLYDRRDGDDDIMMDDNQATGDMDLIEVQRLRDQVCADIPVSTAQCEDGWVDISAFVCASAGWRPSARMRLNVWKRMMEGAILQGIDLEKQFLVGDLWKSVLDDDDASEAPFPRALLEALVRKLCTADERPPLADEIKWASFDKVECSRWVGETYLAAMAPTASSAIGRSEFLRSWKDSLPESWRSEASLSKLQDGAYQSPDPTTIFFVEPSQRQHTAKASAGAAAAKAKPTRNWHELLKSQKRN